MRGARSIARRRTTRRCRGGATLVTGGWLALACLLVLMPVTAARVEGTPISLILEPSSMVGVPGNTVTFVGRITNLSGVSLNSTDLFFNFSGFVPLIVTPDQLLGNPAFVLPDNSISAAVNLFRISVAANAPVGSVHDVDALVQDVNGNVSNVVTIRVIVGYADVLATHPFLTWIEALARAGITGGCGASPPRYCPDDGVTRGQMAVFLLRGIHGASYQPPAATGTMFTDVPASHAFASWIEQLAREGVTAGCSTSPPAYCPGATVTRGQMAVFLLRSKHGTGYQPPVATGSFADVPLDHPFVRWIEQLAREGITGGCSTSPARYCPEQPVTRGQMAVFLTRAFNLPL